MCLEVLVAVSRVKSRQVSEIKKKFSKATGVSWLGVKWYPTDRGPVAVTGNGADSLLPPVTRSSEGLFSVSWPAVTSGGLVTVTRNEHVLPFPPRNYAQPWRWCFGALY